MPVDLLEHLEIQVLSYLVAMNALDMLMLVTTEHEFYLHKHQVVCCVLCSVNHSLK